MTMKKTKNKIVQTARINRFALLLAFVFIIILVSYMVMEQHTAITTAPLTLAAKKISDNIIDSDMQNQFSLHYDLKSVGRIIIYYPRPLITGGPASLNYLHCALVTAGFNSFMHVPNPHYISTTCTRPISAEFRLTSKDLVVVHENAVVSLFRNWKINGSRIVVYLLGFHEPLRVRHRTDVIWASRLAYGRDLYLATGKQVMFAPLERRFYEIQKIDSDNQHRQNVYTYLKLNENLILLDNDFSFPPSLRSALEALPLSPPVTFQIMKNVPPKDMHSWYQRAKIVVDLGVPGAERINPEGALFDAIVLVAENLNGIDPNDFPIPVEFKLDPQNETQMFEIIKRCLINYSTLVPLWYSFKQFILGLPQRFEHVDVPSFFSSRSVKFLLKASSLEEESAIIPFALHCAYHYPLARIEVFIRNLTYFKVSHDMMLKLLGSVTNLSPDWLLLKQSGKNDRISIKESEFIISMDPRNFIVDDKFVNLLVHILDRTPSITLQSSLFGQSSRLVGNVKISRAVSFTKSKSMEILAIPNNYSIFLQEQIINVYAERTAISDETTARLAALLYKSQRHKLLRTMLPLALPRFTLAMAKFEKLYPRCHMTQF